MSIFMTNCGVKKHCANEGASCRNCVRNKNVLLPTDKFCSKVTYVDFIAKKVVVKEGESLPKEDYEKKQGRKIIK